MSNTDRLNAYGSVTHQDHITHLIPTFSHGLELVAQEYDATNEFANRCADICELAIKVRREFALIIGVDDNDIFRSIYLYLDPELLTDEEVISKIVALADKNPYIDCKSEDILINPDSDRKLPTLLSKGRIRPFPRFNIKV